MEGGHEVADELVPALEALAQVLVGEEVRELGLHEGAEEFLDQLSAKLGLELLEEGVALGEFLMVVEHRVFDVDLDLVVEDFGERLAGATVVQLNKPHVDLLKLGGRELLALRVHQKDVVD
jgi:hypothetical protein